MVVDSMVSMQNQLIAGILTDMDKLQHMMGQLHREHEKIKRHVFPRPPSIPAPPKSFQRPGSVPSSEAPRVRTPPPRRPLTVPSNRVELPRIPTPPTAPRHRPPSARRHRNVREPPTPYAFGKGMMMMA